MLSIEKKSIKGLIFIEKSLHYQTKTIQQQTTLQEQLLWCVLKDNFAIKGLHKR